MKNLKIKLGLFSFLTAITLSVFLTSCEQEEIISNSPLGDQQKKGVQSKLDKTLLNYDVIQINYEKRFNHAKKNSNRPFTINFDIPSKKGWEFTLIEEDLSDMYSEDFKAYEITAGDNLIERELHEIRAFKGQLKNAKKNSYFTFALGRIEGSIMDEKGEEYYVESMINYDKNAGADQYVIYKTKDVISTEDVVCTDDESASDEYDDTKINSSEKAATCSLVDVTYLGDYKLYRDKFGSNWTNTINWMWNRFYFANRRYWANNGVKVNWRIKRYYLHSSPNWMPRSYWNKETFMAECNDYYYYSWYTRGDVNMIWTGYDVSGVLGKANGIGKMCKAPANAFCFGEKQSSATKSSRLMAHEIGHTMGMYHDNNSNNFMHKYSSKWSDNLGSSAKNNLSNHISSYNHCLSTTNCK